MAVGSRNYPQPTSPIQWACRGAGVRIVEPLIAVSGALRASAGRLRFGKPVATVYHPLDYAWDVHEAYLRRYGEGTGRCVLVGMNPGPFGMVQTGVPFGDPNIVRHWLELHGVVHAPAHTHPKRPVQGFAQQRGEVSGQRLWGWARDRFGSPDAFLARFFVVNWCPLAFVDEGGRNLTPDRLDPSDRRPLEELCDDFLGQTLEVLRPSRVVGVGVFAESRVRRVVADGVPVGKIPHPSPASPLANRGWADAAHAALVAQGVL